MINELLSPRPRLLLLCAGVVLAVTTRFEAILYVGLLGLSVVLRPGAARLLGDRPHRASSRSHCCRAGGSRCSRTSCPTRSGQSGGHPTRRSASEIGWRAHWSCPAFFVVPLARARGRRTIGLRASPALSASPTTASRDRRGSCHRRRRDGDPDRKALGLLRTHALTSRFRRHCC